MWKGVMYEWVSLPDGKHACVYLFGNPIIYWIVLLGVFIGLIYGDHFVYVSMFVDNAKNSPIVMGNLLLCTLGYFANYIPYPLLIKRPCYLYHYHPALIFGIFLLGSILDALKRKRYFNNIIYYFLIFIIISASFASYIHFLPFSYNLPLTEEEHQMRRWFNDIFKYW